MKEIARTQVRMPPELMQNMKHIADERFTSMNTIIVEAIQQYIDNKKADCIRQDNQSAYVQP